jgi:hypothetical protein
LFIYLHVFSTHSIEVPDHEYHNLTLPFPRIPHLPLLDDKPLALTNGILSTLSLDFQRIFHPVMREAGPQLLVEDFTNWNIPPLSEDFYDTGKIYSTKVRLF